MQMRGRAWVFGDDIPIDGQMMPMRFIIQQKYDFDEMAKYLMSGVDAEFPKKVRRGDLIVGGLNFGHGNAHVHAFLTMRHLGLGVLAETMPRGGFRAAINAGVPVLRSCPGIRRVVADGDEVEVDFSSGSIRNVRTGQQLRTSPLPQILRDIIQAGSGFAYAKQVYTQRHKEQPCERSSSPA